VHRLANEPAFAGVTVFKVDFDSSKDVLREWKVSQQSTLLAFKGTKETLRSTGETDADALRKVFQAAL
jgi:thioredoxin 1